MAETCYYCENKAATKKRYNQPACEECYKAEIRAIVPPRELSEEDKARMLKFMISAFRYAYRESE